MKNYFLLFAFVGILNSCSTDKITTYYLIRHAEKDTADSTNKNPSLSKEGQERAKKWANYFKNIHLDAVYSTNYNRTLQTAKPTADDKKIEIQNYDPIKMYDSIFKNTTKGKTTLIVGHSNTTPLFVNKILDDKKYQNMDETDNSSLFIVTIVGSKKTSRIEKID